jgi:HJR/Mrr/RecB family endonuclease
LLSDGLCIALLKNIRFLETQIRSEQIPHHYEAFSIVDFDYSRESTVVKYLSYLFEKIGCKTQKEATLDSKLRPDLLVTFEDKRVAVEVKRYLNSRNATFLLERFAQLATDKSYKILLITNSRLSPDTIQLFLSKNVTLIDRTALYEIIERNEALLSYVQ